MAKYGQAKYNTFKYGRYRLVRRASREDVIFRMRAGGPNIINQKITIDKEVSLIRMKINNGNWVATQSITMPKRPYILRIKSVGTTESSWMVTTKAILERIETE